MEFNSEYSVLMSIYYKETVEFLRLSIESILNQTVKANDIVLVKDGKLTNELDFLIDEYKNNYPQIFNIVELKENVGLGKALNIGLQHCKNELVARMDSDDISKNNRCEMQLREFKNDNELIIVGTMIDEFYDNPEVVISSRIVPTKFKDIYEFGKRRSPFNHPTVMYKKSKVMECGGYSDLRRNQDVDLFGRMLFNGYKAINIDKSLLLFRSNKELSKRRRSWENTKSYIGTIRRLWKLGYSSFGDYIIVIIGQTIMFLCPLKLQNILYKKFLRR